jgi:diguanylate cyclase (GGDEF)-like protein
VAKVSYGCYFLGEYAFGYLLLAGCYNFTTGATLLRKDCWAFAPGLLIAFGLPLLSDKLDFFYAPHAAIMAGFFVLAYRALRQVRQREPQGAGFHVMSIALLLLIVHFLHYVAFCGYAGLTDQTLRYAYLKYSALYDSMLQLLLAFGAVMVVLESVRFELEAANKELQAASLQLQALARRDPMTEALNRHAFYSLMKGNLGAPIQSFTGCVALIDMDNLKPINDNLGHAAGDNAIRKVAGAIRALIRADDLLFRWGGDEFLVILPGVGENEVRSRLDRLNTMLADADLRTPSGPVALSVSYGVAPFQTLDGLEQAIEQADGEMYSRKQMRKTASREMRNPQVQCPVP